MSNKDTELTNKDIAFGAWIGIPVGIAIALMIFFKPIMIWWLLKWAIIIGVALFIVFVFVAIFAFLAASWREVKESNEK